MSNQSRMARVVLYNTTIQAQAGGITTKNNEKYAPVGSEDIQPIIKTKTKASIKKKKKSKK